MTRREKVMAVITLLAIWSSGVRAHDAAVPGTPRAQIVGGGVLEGWELTIGGVSMCDSLDVRSYNRTIECEIEEE